MDHRRTFLLKLGAHRQTREPISKGYSRTGVIAFHIQLPSTYPCLTNPFYTSFF